LKSIKAHKNLPLYSITLLVLTLSQRDRSCRGVFRGVF